MRGDLNDFRKGKCVVRISSIDQKKPGAVQGKTRGLSASPVCSRKSTVRDKHSLDRNLGNQRVMRMTAQRTPISPRIQRDPPPAPNPCPDGIKKFDVFGVNLPGSTRNLYNDEAKANTVLAQCCAGINIVGGESWDTTLLDLQAPHGSLNEFKSMASPTAEETTMLAHAPGGSVIHAYYVPKMSDRSRGENFRPSVNPAVPKAVVVSDTAAVDTFVHELGHILFDVSAHHANPDNLMASGSIRNEGVDNITATQCGRI